MQIKLFTIGIGQGDAGESELNAFLRGNRILDVESHLVPMAGGANWCFCVRYIERGMGDKESGKKKDGKVDYRGILDEVTFRKFSKLREIRKKVAAAEAVSAFIVFTDLELVEMARLEEITEKSMLSIKGIGEKKVERYAQYFIAIPGSDEETGIPS